MRILCIDDSPPDALGRVLCVGVMTRDKEVEGVLTFRVRRDGTDSADELIAAVEKSRFAGHAKIIVTNGVTFGGLNLLDVRKIVGELGVPWVGVVRRRPSDGAMGKALAAAHDDKRLLRRKLVLLENAGENHSAGNTFFQAMGIGPEEAGRLLKGGYPGGLRLAHLVATAVAEGESHGRS
ncbi:MAG: DUF99 family protein [Candidatus Micrarchaeota archaeon]